MVENEAMNMVSAIKMILVVMILMALSFAGCATKYSHPTKSPKDFERDQRDCQAIAEKSAAKKGVPVCEETRNCLETRKGWRRVLW